MTASTLPQAGQRTTAPGLLPGAAGPGHPAYATAGRAPGRTRPRTDDRPGFWRAPFSGAAFREIGYTLTSLPVAIAGFTFAVTMSMLGAALVLTALGVPVLAAALAGARGLGSAERGRTRGLLGLDVGAPGPVPAPRTPGRWAALTARLGDTAGWKALLFHTVMFPWRVLSFVLSLTFLVTGWTVALLPAYSWVFPHYVGWPGYRLYDYTSGGVHHSFYLSSPFQIAGASALGLVIVFLTPALVRALTNVDRAAVRGLLGK